MERLSCRVPDEREIREFAKELNEIAGRNGIAVAGWAASVDIGTYNTCGNGCVYCYANHRANSAESNLLKYDPASPILCGGSR